MVLWPMSEIGFCVRNRIWDGEIIHQRNRESDTQQPAGGPLFLLYCEVNGGYSCIANVRVTYHCECINLSDTLARCINQAIISQHGA